MTEAGRGILVFMNMEKPVVAKVATQEKGDAALAAPESGTETKEASNDQLLDRVVNASLEMGFPLRQPAAVAALEQAGIQDPTLKGDRSMEAADRYTGEVSRVTGVVNVEMNRAIRALSAEEQEALARAFFDRTIGVSIDNTQNAYRMYLSLKGTPFGDTFHALEDSRLKAAGPSGNAAGFVM